MKKMPISYGVLEGEDNHNQTETKFKTTLAAQWVTSSFSETTSLCSVVLLGNPSET